MSTPDLDRSLQKIQDYMDLKSLPIKNISPEVINCLNKVIDVSEFDEYSLLYDAYKLECCWEVHNISHHNGSIYMQRSGVMIIDDKAKIEIIKHYIPIVNKEMASRAEKRFLKYLLDKEKTRSGMEF